VHALSLLLAPESGREVSQVPSAAGYVYVYQGKELMKAPSECRNLTDIRTAVNSIDRELINLLGRRARYALAALTFKHDRKDIADPAHRRKMFAQRRQWRSARTSILK
jgi:chorismate mutase